MENETPDRKKLLLLTLPLIGVIIFSAFLQVFVLSRHDEIVNLVDGLGGGFIFAYVLIQFLAIVIAPIGGAFIWIMMIAVLGPAKGLLLGYFVMTPAYFVNFILRKDLFGFSPDFADADTHAQLLRHPDADANH